jgi:cell wall-associated NlpC family hydrolase
LSDPRLTPARDDLAAAQLQGTIKAPRYVEGAVHQVRVGATPLREAPTHSSRLETQLLRGELFTIYDTVGGWAWGQAVQDNYVGYAELAAFSTAIIPPTHRVGVLRTLIFPAPDIKSSPPSFLSLNAKVTVEAVTGRFAKLAGGGYAIQAHLAALDAKVSDWVASAELFLHTPYLWGGKDSFGIDCSGLVQAALETGGVFALRDSDMQEASLGEEIPLSSDLSGLRRGDLVFWRGHVGIMASASELLHASGFHMMVSTEKLADAATRILPSDGPITSLRRV